MTIIFGLATGQARLGGTTRLDEAFAFRDLSPEGGAFWSIGIVKHRIRAFTEIIGHRRYLDVGVRYAISNHERRQVNPDETARYQGSLLVLLVYDGCNMRRISTAITL